MKQQEQCRAVVEKLVPRGKHGPYAVARCDGLGSVTFSLSPPVWLEEEWPARGETVVLGEMRMTVGGWRAKSARYWQPSDEQQQEPRGSKAKSRKQGEDRGK